jgi:chemotaxis signal transduction protein
MADTRAKDPLRELSAVAAAMRADFDHAFTQDHVQAEAARIDFLVIEVRADRYALRVDELDALHTDRTVVAVASRLPELLGLAAFRGKIAPVYDLQQLLGYGPGPSSRWVALARARTAVAFAFERFDHHLRAKPTDLLEAMSSAGAAAPFVSGTVRDQAVAHPVLHVPSLVAAITRRITARFTPDKGMIDELDVQ